LRLGRLLYIVKPNVAILNIQQIRCRLVSIFQPNCCLDYSSANFAWISCCNLAYCTFWQLRLLLAIKFRLSSSCRNLFCGSFALFN